LFSLSSLVILGIIPGLFLGVRVLLALDGDVAKIIAGLVPGRGKALTVVR